MANTQAPFGFQVISGTGSAPTYETVTRKIAAANTTAIYNGDPIVSLNTGYITIATAGTTQIGGIFVGCLYTKATGGVAFSPYWPGSGAVAGSDVTAYIINDPNAKFKVQAGGSTTAIGFADINANLNFAIGTGSAATGLSGAYADQTTLNTTATLAFRVVDVITDPAGTQGTDLTTGYNFIVVAFNNVDTKSLTGI